MVSKINLGLRCFWEIVFDGVTHTVLSDMQGKTHFARKYKQVSLKCEYLICIKTIPFYVNVYVLSHASRIKFQRNYKTFATQICLHSLRQRQR